MLRVPNLLLNISAGALAATAGGGNLPEKEIKDITVFFFSMTERAGGGLKAAGFKS